MRARFVRKKKTKKSLLSIFSPKSLILGAEPDYPLLFSTLTLLIFGWAMVYSASGLFAEAKYGDQFFFLKRQILWSMIGFMGFLAASNIPTSFWQKSTKSIYLLTLIGLVVVLFVGPDISGARRWIRLGPIGVQPSEFAKLAMIFLVADYLDRRQSRLKDFKKGLMPLLILTSIIMGLILVEPDLGTPVLMGAVLLGMLILGGARYKHLIITGLVALPIVAIAVFRVRYRVERMFAYLDPWSDPYGSGYQLVQSLLALGSGGIFGAGLGNSKIKIAHLPDAHTDFVFSVLGEELGLVGTLLCMSLFLFILFRGLSIASRAKTCFSSIVAAGISLMIGFQAVINMGVASGLFPTKGMPLPFLSFGGSSMIVTLASIGILIRISKEIKQADK